MSKYKLFWVTTEDHAEDWFVVADSQLNAEMFFDNFEGYDSGESTGVG